MKRLDGHFFLGTKVRLVVLATFLLLLGLMSFLVWLSDHSQTELQKINVDRLTEEIRNSAAVTSYFYAERIRDVEDLATSREVTAFFENQALGMTMSYGLRSSLVNIDALFRKYLQRMQIDGATLFEYFRFYDPSGKILAEHYAQTTKLNQGSEWGVVSTPEALKSRILVEIKEPKSRVLVAVPCFFKDRYLGHIVGRINCQKVFPFWTLPSVSHFTQKKVFLIYHKFNSYSCLNETKEKRPILDLIYRDPPKHGQLRRVELSDASEGEKEWLILSDSVKGTPFDLTIMVPSREIFGRMASWQITAVMAGLSLLVLLGLGYIWRAALTKFKLESLNQILESQVAKRTAELQAQSEALASANCELEKEMAERKLAEEERGKLEAQVRQSQKMEALGTLAGGIAHDFNNILAIIIGYVELARQDAPAGGKFKPYLDRVLEAGERAAALVRSILSFSRSREMEARPIYVRPTIKEALKLLRAAIPANIEIKEDLEAEPAPILGDQTQIHQLLMNLCTNAAHAMRGKGGRLSVSLKPAEVDPGQAATDLDLRPGRYMVLAVADTGQGIDPKIIDRIFEPYFTTKGPETGTGLGLAVVHGIVKNHGGAIKVSSRPGQGATFQVYLPAAEETPRDEAAGRGFGEIRGQGKVLVVDDEAFIIDMLKTGLEKLGHSVTALTRSREALELFTKDPGCFDLAVIDQSMPEMTGLELFTELVALRPGFPVIMCTGFSESVNKDLARAMGIREFMLKPVAIAEMASAIRAIMEKQESPEAAS